MPVAGIRLGVPGRDLLGDDLQIRAADLGGRAVEVGVHEGLVQTDGLEDLSAAVGGDGGDAHLGHHLQHALAERLDQVADGFLGGHVAGQEGAVPYEVLDGLHREVRVDGGGAVADEQRHMVHLAYVARLDQQTDPGALLGADQVVVDRGGQQQGRDRCVLGVGVPVGEDDQPGAASMAASASAQISLSRAASPLAPPCTR